MLHREFLVEKSFPAQSASCRRCPGKVKIQGIGGYSAGLAILGCLCISNRKIANLISINLLRHWSLSQQFCPNNGIQLFHQSFWGDNVNVQTCMCYDSIHHEMSPTLYMYSLYDTNLCSLMPHGTFYGYWCESYERYNAVFIQRVSMCNISANRIPLQCAPG